MGVIRNLVNTVSKVPVIGKLVDPFDISGAKAMASQKASAASASAAADQAAAAKAASDSQAAASKQAATDQATAQTIATNKDESRRAALSDMLAGEGDQNQRRRFLKGAK